MHPLALRCVLASVVVASASLLAWPVAGQPTEIDMIEHTFGASNTNAVAGHGRLTVGIGAEGDLSVLSWPSPSYYDQIAYISSNALDVREQPHLGALDGMGSYLGLLVEEGGGPTLTWLRDADWERKQSYSQPTAPVPVTRFRRDDLGLTVVLTDVVSPEADVLTRHLRVERDGGSPVTGVSLVAYENLSPTLSLIPEIPVADWGLDARNDFLAVYDASRKHIVHLHPGDRAIIDSLLGITSDPTEVDYGPVEALMKQAAPSEGDIDAFAADLDGAYEPGVVGLVTTEPAPTSFQVGSDATPICGQVDTLVDNVQALPETFPEASLLLDPEVAAALRCEDALDDIRDAHGWQWQPEDALADLDDGTLSGSRLAAGQTNGALVAPLSFSGDVAEGAMLVAFGATHAEARDALEAGTDEGFAARQAAAEQAADAALGDLALPTDFDPPVTTVATRALTNIYVARDAERGGIMASISRQPPYFLDWPRDGAFFSAALDVAGRSDWVGQRFRWFTELQRTEVTKGNPLLTPDVPTDPVTGEVGFPAGAWEMNYFAEGTVGGPIRFEIDNTALHVWSLALHAAHLEGVEREDFLSEIWPSTQRALDLLVRWREPDTGLPALANEDDNIELTSGLHGAVSVHAALEAGSRLAFATGRLAEARTYLATARELREAIITHYYDESTGLFRLRRGEPPVTGNGTTAWLVWPGRVLEPDDPRLEAQLVADMETVLTRLRGETEGGSYTPKNIQSAALYGKEGGAKDMAREALALLAAAATPDTHHYGEVYVSVSDPGETPVEWSNRVAPPHVWAGTLFYMAAMSFDHRERFLLDEQLPLPPEAEEEGCGCTVVGAPAGPGWPLVSLLGLWLVRRRRRG